MERSQSRATPAKPPRAVFIPDPGLIDLGTRLANEVFNSGRWERMRPYYSDANSKDEPIRRNGMAVLLGFGMRAAQVIHVLVENRTIRNAGTGGPLTADDLLYSFRTSQNRFLVQLNATTSALAQCIVAVPGMEVVERAGGADKAPPAPIPVQVMGMPARVTETEIERNGAGDIQRTTQIEVDFKNQAANANG